MYSTKQAFWDFRPLSEYFYEQTLGRKGFRFLFYCRTCVKNFDAPIRVQKCKFCAGQDIVELPKEVWKRRQVFKRKMSISAKTAFANFLRTMKSKRSTFDFETRLRLALLYYFDYPAEPTEESAGAEDVSQADLLKSFRLV